MVNKTVRFLRGTRKDKNGLRTLMGLLRQSVFGRLACYEGVNGATRLARDPGVRQIVGGHAVERQAVFCDVYSLTIYLQTLCCFRISCSSSLHKVYDEPETLLYENIKPVPQALLLDNVRQKRS